MSNPVTESSGGGDRDRLMSAMFASMVIQNANMALIFLGQAPNPQTGETVQDLENAKYFIDQLEMIEARTRGNLSQQTSPATDEQEMPIVEPTLPGETAAPQAAEEVESKKKFTKKY
jgi:hypothetical protein